MKVEVQEADAVSIRADMWTSVNMDVLTCHCINENMQLCACWERNTFHKVKGGTMDDWAITDKVKRLVIEAAPNMIASTEHLHIQHSVCIAHTLNLIVKKSCDQIPAFTSIRHKSKHIVTYFRSSTTVKEQQQQGAQEQQQMG